MDFYNSLSPQRPHTQDHHLVPSLTTSNTTSAYSHSTTRSSESSSRPSGQHGLSFETQHRISHESKPRLSKDQQDVLEKHFQDQPKPSTQTKKVFSESLNVPLDKINNWFQNRRAKVKQEAKKQQSASMMQYAQRVHMVNSQQQGQYVNPAMYHPMMDVTPRHSMIIPNGMQIPMPAEFTEPLVSGAPFIAQGPDGSQIPMQGIMMEPTMDDSPGVFNTFFGLDDSFQTYNNNFNQNALADFGKTFNHAPEAFDPMQTIPEIEAYSTAESSVTQSSRDDTSLHIGGMGYEEPMRSAPQIMQATTMPIRHIKREGPAPQKTIHRGPDMRVQPESKPIPHNLFVPPTNATQLPLRTMPNQQPTPEQQAALDAAMQQNPILSLGIPSGPPPTDFAPNMHNPVHTMVQDAKTLYPSPPDDMSGVHPMNMPQNPTTNPIMDLKPQMPVVQSPSLKQPHAGMGARRAKRPAALGALSSANRSSSYTNVNMPVTSPKPLTQVSTPDHQLRRVRSSFGVLNGRITKGTPSAQKSPIAFNFPPGSTDSPRMVKQMSMQSLSAVAASQAPMADAVPMTPMSPMELSSTPLNGQNMHRMQQAMSEAGPEAPADPSWVNMPDSFESVPTPFFTSQAGTPQSTAHPGQVLTSPPRTPMEVTMPFQAPPQHMMQTPQGQMMPPPIPQSMAVHMPQAMPQGFTPQQLSQMGGAIPAFAPQAMPPWANGMSPAQYLGGRPMPSTPGEDVMNMFEASRRPSLMTNVSPSTVVSPMIHASPEVPSGHSRFPQPAQYMSPQFAGGSAMFQGIAPEMQHMYMQGMPMNNAHVAASIGSISPTQLVGSPASMGMMGIPPGAFPGMLGSKHASPDLQVHEYEPKDQVDVNKLAPKNRNLSQPKIFNFQNTSAANYNGTSPQGA